MERRRVLTSAGELRIIPGLAQDAIQRDDVPKHTGYSAVW